MTVTRIAMLAVLLGSASSTDAAEQQVVTIKGVVYAAIPCVINKNAPISAPFGDVQTAGIDGSYKTITLEYTLDCSRSTSNELRMQVRGTPASAFNPALLVVPGYDSLGIALKKDGARLAVNTWADFDTRKQPVLQAVLVKRENREIKAGAFKASATLVVDYR
ncbi:fimbrial protein [Pseudomonas alkylphenolica]|uniref:Exported pilin protein MrfE n=1 Tax=Pseudomonas alkylphenolica TaxID=237609 RepID=A0A077F8X0_9PSED|nr:fimbrial protein [Pseudomonas alkylphenolica]AIL61833.1 exported pilin protein MrfE [Pseudomonas alkylphenolica]